MLLLVPLLYSSALLCVVGAITSPSFAFLFVGALMYTGIDNGWPMPYYFLGISLTFFEGIHLFRMLCCTGVILFHIFPLWYWLPANAAILLIYLLGPFGMLFLWTA